MGNARPPVHPHFGVPTLRCGEALRGGAAVQAKVGPGKARRYAHREADAHQVHVRPSVIATWKPQRRSSTLSSSARSGKGPYSFKAQRPPPTTQVVL